MKRIAFALMLLVAGALTFSSCVRKDYDTPPDMSGYDPHLNVTHTIAELKAMNGRFGTLDDTTLITDDVVISGIVIADDRSGNFYKQIVIQDGTAGIAVDINAYSLYNDYPVGRKIYIKCKGLYLGYNGGTPELGSSISEQKAINGLDGNQIVDHIVKANIGNEVKDTVISLATAMAANPYFINRLVTVVDVEFQDTTRTYTEATATTNRNLVGCASTTNALVTRNSNYANFHALKVPKGHGSVTGIFTVYETSRVTPQLVIRDTSDVKMYDARCNGSGGPVAPLITMDSMRKYWTANGGGTVTMPAARVAVVVISDIDNKNVSSGNFVIEDNSKKGAILYIAGSSAYKLGDSLVVDITGASLKLYNGSLEIDNMTASKVTKVVGGKSIAPVVLNLAQLNANFAQYESVLVQVANATVQGGGTYNGNKTLDDGTGNIVLRTSTTAVFATQNVPTTAKTFTGIATYFNTTKQLGIRNLSDVQ